MSKLEDLKHELDRAKIRARTLQQHIELANADIARWKEELNDLGMGAWSRRGKVQQLEAAVKKEELRESDRQSRQVVWIEGSGSEWSRKDNCVVRKVTPKRIFIAEFGCERTTQYKRDGTSVGDSKYNPVIDLEKTFPEEV